MTSRSGRQVRRSCRVWPGFTTDTISICQSDPQALGFTATIENCYPTASYQWQQSRDSGVTWMNIPGATGASYSRVASGTGVFQYRLTVAQVGNIGVSSCEVASAPIMVTVIPTPDAGGCRSPLPVRTAVVRGVAVEFNGYAGQRQGRVRCISGWLTGSMWVRASRPILTSTLSDGDVISCVMTSDAACVLNPVVTSNTLSMTVSPIPTTSVSIGGRRRIRSVGIVLWCFYGYCLAMGCSAGVSVGGEWGGGGGGGAGGTGGQSAVFSDAQLADGDVVDLYDDVRVWFVRSRSGPRRSRWSFIRYRSFS